MWLLYSTLGEPNAAENALYLGEDVASPLRWEDVRRRANGLVRRDEPCFVWDGQVWNVVSSDEQILNTAEPEVIKIKLIPISGPRLKIRPSIKSSDVASDVSKVPGSQKSSTAAVPNVTAIVPPFDSKATEKVLSDVADTAKKVSSLVGATFSSWAKTATEHYKEATAVEKKFEQIGPIKLRIGKKIAEGGFSEVYIARGPENEVYALKKCRAQTSEQLTQLKREIAAHGTVEHAEHILKLLTSDISPSEGRGSIVRFVFPLCEGGSWYEAFQKNSEEEFNLRIFLGASRGLKSLHEQSILHRDVKPHNVLLTGDGHALLMDLGSSCPMPIKIGTKSSAALLAEEAAEQCSAPYRAPEFWEPKVGKNIAGEADIWSLGCSLFAVTYGKGYSPYEDAIQGVLKLAILNGSPVRFPGGNYSEFLRNLIVRTVVSVPTSRIGLDEIIQDVEAHLETMG